MATEFVAIFTKYHIGGGGSAVTESAGKRCQIIVGVECGATS